jgi:hypothetical protein
MSETLKRIEQLLLEAQARRTWGTIEVSLRDGQAVMLRQMTQTKLEEDKYPNGAYRR